MTKQTAPAAKHAPVHVAGPNPAKTAARPQAPRGPDAAAAVFAALGVPHPATRQVPTAAAPRPSMPTTRPAPKPPTAARPSRPAAPVTHAKPRSHR